MKSLPHNDAFRPVTLLLESQAEVDAIFSVLNNTRVRIALELPRFSYKALDGKQDKQNCEKLHNRLNALPVCLARPTEYFLREITGRTACTLVYRIKDKDAALWVNGSWENTCWSAVVLRSDTRFVPCCENAARANGADTSK